MAWQEWFSTASNAPPGAKPVIWNIQRQRGTPGRAKPFYPSARCIAVPISAGERTTVTPAASSAAIFASAVP